MTGFSTLSQEEIKQLAKAPMYVGLLIAEADGFADTKELEWIEKVTSFRTKLAHHSLRGYYKLANEEVKNNMNLVRSELPTETADKLSLLSDKLAALKPILHKLEPAIQHRLIDSFHSMALSVAEISGGLLNFFSTNPREEKWLALEMLNDE